jgi:hypothetical protein
MPSRTDGAREDYDTGSWPTGHASRERGKEARPMARPTKAASAKRPVTAGRKPGRPKAAAAETPAKIAKPSAAAKRVANSAARAARTSPSSVEVTYAMNSPIRSERAAHRRCRAGAARGPGAVYPGTASPAQLGVWRRHDHHGQHSVRRSPATPDGDASGAA